MKTTPPDGNTPLRSFLALPVPHAALIYASLLQGIFRDQGVTGRRVRPEAMHLTVEFLGDQNPQALGPFKEALRERLTNLPPPLLECQGPDTFGRPPSLLYLAWRDEDFRYRRLTEEIRTICRECSLAPPAGESKRKPVPHMTILRIKDPQAKTRLRKLRRNTNEGAEWKPFLPPVPRGLAEVKSDRVELIASTLTPEGPIYQTLETIPLAG